MADGDLVLAIDQGTSSTRAIAYDAGWTAIAGASRRLAIHHPLPGWAEQDPNAILTSVVETVGEVLEAVGGSRRFAAVGLANQGETVVPWDVRTGEALGPAVVWHCRRSQAIVDRVASAGHGPAIRARTGLPLDPYFSAGKMRWLIDELPAVARAAATGRLAIGTVDAWLTARLGRIARTDSSTASRTQLFGLTSLTWEDDLLEWWGVPRSVLPLAGPSAGQLGELGHASWGGPLPLRAMLCDQQAALVGQGGHRPGTIKATYGTGVFVLAQAGPVAPTPPPGILVTIAWTDADGRPTYALDGGVFSAGSLLDWLRTGLHLIEDPADLDRLAGDVADAGGVRILPALAGLGAPWWDPDARGVIAGLSAASRPGHIARAAIDAIAQRVADVIEAMAPALPDPAAPLRVDGGLTASALLVQRQADLVGRPIDVASVTESTALGVALMAAIGAGRLGEREAAAVPGTVRRIEPHAGEGPRAVERAAWRQFVRQAAALGVSRDHAQPAAIAASTTQEEVPPVSDNRWLRPAKPLVIAHRGHSIEVPENTLEAYSRAIELGTGMIECDVNRTRDGQLVMIHDWRLDRTTSGSGPVRDLTLAEIQALDAGSWMGPEFRGLRVPTTIDTIELAREAGIPMCFEVKGETPDEYARTAVALAELFVERKALEWAFMSSYDHAAMAQAKQRVPDLLLAPERLPDNVLVDPAGALRQAMALGAPVLQNHWAFVTPELVRALREAGIALWSWPTTAPSEIARSLADGVDGVMGDDVAAMVRAVAALGATPD